MTDLTGQMLGGRYRVESFLGRGGMANVYKVWDQQRAVFLAMKVLHSELAEDQVFLKRFEREAHTLELLQHPNIVRFYGLEKAGSLAFILMDFIDGLTLRKEIFLNKRGLPSERILEILRPVCAALYYAHQMGMAHCDIKPANIMAHRNGMVYLTDFGIAHMTEARSQTMMEMGTPAYMAPEQLRGQPSTPAADIYSLGVVLFEMVTGGHRPFTGDSAKTSGTTTRRVIWEKHNLPAPSPRKYKPDISPELESIILRCLEHKPERRYRTALELLEALEVAIHSEGQPDETLTLTDMDTPTGGQPAAVPAATLPDELASAEKILAEAPEFDGEKASDKPSPLFIQRRSAPWYLVGAAALVLAGLSLSFFTNKAHAPGSQPGPQNTPSSTVVSAATGKAPSSPVIQPSATLTQTVSANPTATTALNAPTPTLAPQPTLIGGSGKIAYAWDSGDGTLQVWVMDINNPEIHRQITQEPAGACQPVWSPDGSQIAYTTPCRGPSVYYPGATIKIIRVDNAQLHKLPLNGNGTSGSFDPAWSPDSKTIAFTVIVGERTEIHAINLENNKITVLSNRGKKSAQPAWSPDGEHIAFITTDMNKLHANALWLMGKNGDSQEAFSTAGSFSEPTWSPDGSRILVSVNNGSNIPVLMLFDTANPAQGGKPLLSEVFLMAHGTFSPDGKWIAFWSDRIKTTSREIFLASLDGKEFRQVTDNTLQDFQPAWRPR